MNNKINKTKEIIYEPKDNLVALIEFVRKTDSHIKPNRPKSKDQMVLSKKGEWITL